MKRLRFWPHGLVLASLVASPALGSETLFKPDDFDSVWIEVIDNARNGCWTNIGESKDYAYDQLELAGLKAIEPPDWDERKAHPTLTSDKLIFRVQVKADRWKDGLCVGYIKTYFAGGVALRVRPERLVLNPIGEVFTWATWHPKNLNHYVLDQIRDTIPLWVEIGENLRMPE